MITGVTQCLGRELALALAGDGHTLLLHGRDPERLAEVAERARAEGAAVREYLGDPEDLEDVQRLADEIRAAEPRLDVLVNNAGLGHGEDPSLRETSAQGHELRFAVNLLAPCVLTRELLPLLVESAPSRIVNVASAGQQAIDFNDVMLEQDYDGARACRQSKLAMVMWTFDLAEALREFGVAANALEPSASLQDGVEAIRRLVAAPEFEGVSGLYFEQGSPAQADPQAYDRDARSRLKALVGALAPAAD